MIITASVTSFGLIAKLLHLAVTKGAPAVAHAVKGTNTVRSAASHLRRFTAGSEEAHTDTAASSTTPTPEQTTPNPSSTPSNTPRMGKSA